MELKGNFNFEIKQTFQFRIKRNITIRNVKETKLRNQTKPTTEIDTMSRQNKNRSYKGNVQFEIKITTTIRN